MSGSRATKPAPRRGLRSAAGLLIAGLVVEVVSLGWANPPAFLLFVGVGGLLVAVGVLRYLLATVSRPLEGGSAES